MKGQTNPDEGPTAGAVKGNCVPVSRLLSAQAAAAYLGWPYTTLRDAALRRHLPVVRMPGSRRMWFDRRDLDRAIEIWKQT